LPKSLDSDGPVTEVLSLKRGGALETSRRGVWALTEKGKSLNNYEQAKAICEQVQQEERERARQNG